MSHRITLQSAYVLHARAFRDTSLIVDFFTADHGRLSAVARGARTQRSKFRGLLQAFVPLVISWSGRSELVTLSCVEPSGAPYDFSGSSLLSGLYINELLVRLLATHDPHPELYTCYQAILHELQNPPVCVEASLRGFEKSMLEALGYGFDWQATADTGEGIDPSQWYVFLPDQGFVSALNVQGSQLAFPGAHLHAISQEDWHDPAVLRTAKQLMRAAINPLLHGKPIRTRELFI